MLPDNKWTARTKCSDQRCEQMTAAVPLESVSLWNILKWLEVNKTKQIRTKYGSKMFTRFGVDMHQHLMRGPGEVHEFLNQEPELVARFVSDCLHLRWQNEDDPVPHGDVHTFSADISPSALDSVGWTDSGITVFISYVRVFFFNLPMEPRLAPFGCPTIIRSIGNLV